MTAVCGRINGFLDWWIFGFKFWVSRSPLPGGGTTWNRLALVDIEGFIAAEFLPFLKTRAHDLQNRMCALSSCLFPLPPDLQFYSSPKILQGFLQNHRRRLRFRFFVIRLSRGRMTKKWVYRDGLPGAPLADSLCPGLSSFALSGLRTSAQMVLQRGLFS